MTDARLRGEWLGMMRFDDLSDTAWRVFTGALMWSTENGTDGLVPNRYLRYLHPDGAQPKAHAELIEAGVWTATETGHQLVDWDGALGQSTAQQVETYKANARGRQRAWRERERQKTAKALERSSASSRVVISPTDTGDVTRYETSPGTGHVGQAKAKAQVTTGEGPSIEESAADNETGEVFVEWPVAQIPAACEHGHTVGAACGWPGCDGVAKAVSAA